METATFAAGCFWGVEEAFRRVEGVMETTAGYTGGTVPEPSYRQVCSGTTGHVEAVRVRYDPSAVSYRRLLEVFFAVHDPTTPGRQGPDVGSQYRSVIFHHDEEQKREAVEAITELDASGKYDAPVITKILPAKPFYPAEEYHQRYLEKQRR